jgi:HEAT repeat protein
LLTQADIPSDLPPALRELIAQTFSADFHERKSAARKLGEMHVRAAPAVPFLMRLLSDRDIDDPGFEWDNYADDALVAIGEPALDACIEAANDSSCMEQVYAISCLTKFKSPRAVDALLKLLESSNPDFRQIVTRRFSMRRDPRSVEPLLKLLESPPVWFFGDADRNRHIQTVEALGFQQDQRAVPALLRILQDLEDSIYLRSAAAQSLGQIGDPSAYPVLSDMLQDRSTHPILRSGAALGIGAFYSSRKVPQTSTPNSGREDAQILSALDNVLESDEEPFELRAAVARAMGDTGNQDAIEVLTPLVNSQDRHNLGFWAAVSIVKLSDGKVRNPKVMNVIKNYDEVSEVNGLELKEQHDALRRIAENGAWYLRWYLKPPRWLVLAVPIGVGVIGVAGVWLIFCHRSRVEQTNSATEEVPPPERIDT